MTAERDAYIQGWHAEVSQKLSEATRKDRGQHFGRENGLMHVRDPVSIKFDSFHYSQFGMAEGSVRSSAQTASLRRTQPGASRTPKAALVPFQIRGPCVQFVGDATEGVCDGWVSLRQRSEFSRSPPQEIDVIGHSIWPTSLRLDGLRAKLYGFV